MTGAPECYRIRLRPRTPWLTPWHADTLFGCICWRYSELAGDAALQNWLDAFRASEPPFVLSDAFPDGWLPSPALAEFEDEPKGKTKPPPFITEQMFEAWRLQPGILRRPASPPGEPQDSRRLHATLNRNSGTPLEQGGLYELNAVFTPAGAPAQFSLFLRGTPAVAAAVYASLKLQGVRGFGKRSSAGFGAFTATPPEPCPLFDSFTGANGFIALSHFIPNIADPLDGAWGLEVKYPKLQGDSAEHPFKGRLIALTPGSAFRTDAEPALWYGSTVQILRSERASLHYALCFAVPANLPARSLA